MVSDFRKQTGIQWLGDTKYGLRSQFRLFARTQWQETPVSLSQQIPFPKAADAVSLTGQAVFEYLNSNTLVRDSGREPSTLDQV
jgi:hypothetical protein